MKTIKYRSERSKKDVILFDYGKERGKILKFSIQYLAKLNAHWTKIRRFDTCHGYAHEHMTDGRIKFLGKKKDYNTIFTKLQKDIAKNFLKYKNVYIQHEQKKHRKKP